MTSAAARPPSSATVLDALARNPSATDPRPPDEVRRAHTARIRRLRRTYHLWGWLVAAPGIVMFAISTVGTLGRRAARGTVSLFITHPVLATALLSGGVLLGAGGTAMVHRAGVTMRHHHRLLVRAGVDPDGTGSIIR